MQKQESTTPSSGTKQETKSDGQASKAADKSIVGEKSQEVGAPEKYEDFKVPEGFELDKDVAGEFGAIAKKNNVTQSGAQELVDFYVKQVREAVDAPMNFYMDRQQEWRKEIDQDAEIGGSRLNGTKASIGKLIDSLGDAKLSDSFREAMDYTGAGNHPAVVRFLARVAQRLTEGGPVRGGGPSPEGQRVPGSGSPSAAQAIYPNLPSNQR